MPAHYLGRWPGWPRVHHALNQNNTKPRNLIGTVVGMVVFTIGSTLSGSEANGASFDCRKARTPTEADICADAELSALDDRLGRAYARAIARASSSIERKRIRAEQRTWLAERDKCLDYHHDLVCLERSYKRRLALLENEVSPTTWRVPAASTQGRRTEAAILKQIIGVVRSHSFASPETSTPTAECERALADLKAGTGFQPIEPDVRAEVDSDPRLEKWHRCDQADEADVEDRDNPFLGFYMLGSGPYRYYRIELDGNSQNGPEDVIYWDSNFAKRESGGYAWVDIDACSFRGSARLTNIGFERAPVPGEQSANLLVRYRGEIFALEVAPVGLLPASRGTVRHDATLVRVRIERGRPGGCIWRAEIPY